MQIRPQESFPILYQISDPSDAATYYVRSVIRNSANGAIIQVNGLNFINLTRDPSNTRRFSKLIQAPNDASGLGLFIDIVTSVYTDSGYTVKSTIYEENIDKYLVQERWNTSWGGGGGLADLPKRLKDLVDYKRIEDTFKSHLDLLPPAPIYNDRWDEVLGHTGDIKEAISSIRIPESQSIDLESHTQRILKGVSDHIRSIPKPEPIDFSPVINRLDSIHIPDFPIEVKKYLDDYKDHIKSELQKIAEAIPHNKCVDLMDKLSESIGDRATGRTKTEDPSTNRVKNLLS